MPSLQHQLAELKSVKTAPALWREQARQRLLNTIEATTTRPLTMGEAVVFRFQQLHLVSAQWHVVPVVATALVLVLGYVPLAQALVGSLPGSPLYPVKRAVEKVELSVRSTSGSQGLFYLTLAGRRLTEAQAVGAAETTTQAELLRDYNIALGFAQAGLETGLTSTTLARAYDQTTDMLAANLTTLPTAPQNQLVLSVALELTGKVSARALALLVSAHRQGANGLPQAEVANRLTQEIAKVEAKLGHVDDKIKEFPSVRPAPRVVIESKSTVVPVAEASRQAKESLSEAKELVAKNEFGLALLKVQESEDITSKSEAAVADEAVEGEEPVAPDPAVEGESTEAGEGTVEEPITPGEASPESQPESGGAGEPEPEAPVETPAP